MLRLVFHLLVQRFLKNKRMNRLVSLHNTWLAYLCQSLCFLVDVRRHKLMLEFWLCADPAQLQLEILILGIVVASVDTGISVFSILSMRCAVIDDIHACDVVDCLAHRHVGQVKLLDLGFGNRLALAHSTSIVTLTSNSPWATYFSPQKCTRYPVHARGFDHIQGRCTIRHWADNRAASERTNTGIKGIRRHILTQTVSHRLSRNGLSISVSPVLSFVACSLDQMPTISY